ncbi:hypothetical protein PLICRDRAFT_159882 [Plicaturopsis crispa FD-325 SS-3]|nr:hypothetical protein PLICRDRAFT_159882 [Plicaturopsis crispa FD-325 SS-3]
MIEISTFDSDGDDTSAIPANLQHRKEPNSDKKGKATARGKPAKATSSKHAVSRNQPEQATSTSSGTHGAPQPESSSHHGSGHSSDTARLPEFAVTAWPTVFLPTLYHRLGASEKPWDDFSRGPNVVPIIQQIVNICWPGTTYRVKWDVGICAQAVARTSEKRSLIGSRAIEVVSAHFERPEYANNPKAIAEYAQYATREDGPAIYRTPTPIDCVAEPGSDDYVEPDGLFESHFIIETLKPFFKLTKASRGDYGYMNGALAMAAAAVERAFFMFHTGVRIKAGTFSRDNGAADMVDDYMFTARKVTDSRWKQILDRCGLQVEEQKKAVFIAPSLRNKRRELYIPRSSPQPECGSDSEDRD